VARNERSRLSKALVDDDTHAQSICGNGQIRSPLIGKASANLFIGSFQAGKALQAIYREVSEADAASVSRLSAGMRNSLERFPS